MLGSVPHGLWEETECICCYWEDLGPMGLFSTEISDRNFSLLSLIPTFGETASGHGAEEHFSRSPDYSPLFPLPWVAGWLTSLVVSLGLASGQSPQLSSTALH